MESYVLGVSNQALLLTLILSGPPILAAMIVGLIISLVQATTQVQEQTLTFVPKMVVVFLVLALLGPIGMAQLVTFTHTLLTTFPDFIK
ncbi:MAG TPA: EscS/YscS/HrcS family type III secretion system export apparatus protein [Deltaproteobacteria bacterium]|nr:MAG: EscS/YscS/HrcS family type III secretion system export apparatus protein [Deltaproteobacteria bacterium GWA2_45_12]HBF13666.1 EscS/YscS/HrcS family type III secretion system export apparatus protein [Deltaproteobacteria bacterium]